MNMKSIIFIAHDPGGYDVTSPIVDDLIRRKYKVEYYCFGPSYEKKPNKEITKDDFHEYLLKKLIKEDVSILVTGTSWGTNLEVDAIDYCKKYGVTTISILDYWSNYSNRFIKKNKGFIFPDYLIVMDELAQKEAICDGVPENIIKVLGHPGLDEYVNNSKKINTESRDVLFISQPISTLYNYALGFTEESVLSDCFSMKSEFPNIINIDIKFHPKDNLLFQDKYKQYRIDGDLDELLPQYKIIIGMNSVVLLHASLLGCNVISYQPNLVGEDLCINNKLGITHRIHNYRMLIETASKLFGEDKKMGLINLPNLCIWKDGKSTHRVSEFIRKCITI